MSTQEEREKIMKAILAVLEIDEEVQKKLADEGFTTPRKVANATMDSLERAMENKYLNEADTNDIKNWKEWMAHITSD